VIVVRVTAAQLAPRFAEPLIVVVAATLVAATMIAARASQHGSWQRSSSPHFSC